MLQLCPTDFSLFLSVWFRVEFLKTRSADDAPVVKWTKFTLQILSLVVKQTKSQKLQSGKTGCGCEVDHVVGEDFIILRGKGVLYRG